MSTFTWTPDYDPQVSHEPKVRSAQFGDGYRQRSKMGINSDLPTWSLTFSVRSKAEAEAIDAFLIAAAGVDAFTWTPPGGTAALYTCAKWARSIQDGSQTVTAEFKQEMG